MHSPPPPRCAFNTTIKTRGFVTTTLPYQLHYKNVVNEVEKFIKKAKPEYRLTALYIIDAIVRGSMRSLPPELSPMWLECVLTASSRVQAVRSERHVRWSFCRQS
jgi:hypothetical protein